MVLGVSYLRVLAQRSTGCCSASIYIYPGIYIYIYIYRPEILYITHKKHGMLFTGTRIYTSSQILHIYGVSMVICGGLPTRLAAANHHKPPPKRHKYAGFGTIGIRESIVLHRQGLATLKEPQLGQTTCLNYQHTNIIIPNSGGGLQWFTVVCGGFLLSTVFTTNRPKFWW